MDQLVIVSKHLTAVNFARDEYIFRIGSLDRSCYLVASGSLEVVAEDDATQEVRVLREVVAPDHFGEIALLKDGSVRTASVRCTSDCTLLVLDQKNFELLAGKHKWFAPCKRRLRLTADHRMSNFLKNVPFLADIDEVKLGLLGSLLQMMVIESGETIFNEGESGDRFFIIIKGSVRVTANNQGGDEIASRDLGEGNYFGEIALISRIPRTATVTALEQCFCLQLNKPAFQNFLNVLPDETQVAIKGKMQERAQNFISHEVEDLIEVDQIGLEQKN